MTEQSTTKLAKAISSYYSINPSYSTTDDGQLFIGDTSPASPILIPYHIRSRILPSPIKYEDELFQCRYFYKKDPIASTVIDRMAEMVAGKLLHKIEYCTQEEYYYYCGLSQRLSEFIQTAALEYFVSGMAVPDYGISKTMGNKLHPKLGRKRYSYPDPLWTRNSDNIVLRRQPIGPYRSVYLKIPPEERDFIQNNGVRSDGTEDKELYAKLVRQFPEYVKMIKEGRSLIPLPNSRPILRKALPNCDYPQPFLTSALAALKHKLRITEMDYSIATRAIEAILLIKAGSDQFPVTEDDTTLKDLKTQMSSRTSVSLQELIYRLYTNHTVDMEWIYPPFEALLSPNKYVAVDNDILMAMGFSRVLLTGESLRSNASTGNTTIIGPLATLQEARNNILCWVRKLYEELAELNNFSNIPEPYLESLTINDMQTLIQYASKALKDEAISRNTYAQLFNSTFDEEQQQRIRESEFLQENINSNPLEVIQRQIQEKQLNQQTDQTNTN